MGLYTVASPSKLNDTHTKKNAFTDKLLSCRLECSSIFKSCVFNKRIKKEKKKMIEIDFSRVQITGEIVLREPLQN